MCKAHAECPPSIRRQKRGTLPSPSLLTACYLSRTGGLLWPPARCFSSTYILPVSPFVVARARRKLRPHAVPGTTRKHANDPTTALQSFRRASARSYSGHTPPLRLLNHRADEARHRATKRGSHTGSCVSTSLRFMGHVAIQCYPEDTAAVCRTFRHGTVCEPPRGGSISGSRT